MSEDSPLTLAAGFPEVSHETWLAEVQRVLSRGREMDDEKLRRAVDKLTTRTVDGLTIKPIYNGKTDPPQPPAPGTAPFTRGTSVPTEGHDWIISQGAFIGCDGVDPADEVATGATGVTIFADTLYTMLPGVGKDAPLTTEDITAVLDGVDLTTVPVTLVAGHNQLDSAKALLEVLTANGNHHAAGNLGLDPLGEWLITAGATDLAADTATVIETAKHVAENAPGIRPIIVNAALIHETGGGDVEELGTSLAFGVYWLRALTDAGFSVDDAAELIEFRYAATPDQFLTAAKLRAARRTWARIVEASGGEAAAQRQRQHAITSVAATSVYDIWVNLLRVTTATFAAAIGSADTITVLPHDQLLTPGGSPLGRRMARHTQVVLAEESHLGAVLDPAGGSWYVESLTDDVANAGWAWFQRIENEGGIVDAAKNDVLQNQLADVAEKRTKAIATRRHPLTGVTEFPEILDELPPQPVPYEAPRGEITPLVPHRYAAPVEAQRDRADQTVRDGGERPEIFLVTLDRPAVHTARATFAKNLFEVGGIRAIVPDGFSTPEEAAAAFVESGAPLACICSSDKVYEEHAEAVAEALKQLDAPPALLYQAGRPGEQYTAASVDRFIFMGVDVLEVLTEAHDVVSK